MNYTQYVQGIHFGCLQPQSTPRWIKKLVMRMGRWGQALAIANTRLPQDRREMLARLDRLRDVPRMSTVAIGAMINQAVANMPDDQCFVNVGVWHGFTFLAGLVGNPGKHCIGVDNFSQFGGPKTEFLERFGRLKSERHEFHEQDYVRYFHKVHRRPIGFYIYDGEHSYENQLRGLQIAEPYFAKGCLILVDDTNFAEPRQATLDFMERSSFHYDVLLDRRTSGNLDPTLWNGVMILQRTTRHAIAPERGASSAAERDESLHRQMVSASL